MSTLLLGAIALAIGSGVIIRISNSTDMHITPAMAFTRNEQIQHAHLRPIHSHKVLKESQAFRNKDGLLIRTVSWMPEGKPKAVAFIVHGYAEHALRYNHVAKELVEIGIAVYALDHQGHGRSEGERVYVRNFEDYAVDVLHFVKSIELINGQKRFLIGHSMGGLIAAHVASMEPKLFDAVVLSSPFLMLNDETLAKKPILMPILSVISYLFPKMVIDPGLDAQFISKDPAIVADYLNDPLVFNEVGIRARWVIEADRIQTLLSNEKYARITTPILVMQAGKDKLVNVKGASILYENAPSKDKTLKVFENYEHELFNEPETDENGKNPPIELMRTWLKSKL